MSASRELRAALAVAMTALCLACGSAEAPAPIGPVEATTDSGAWALSVVLEPDPPVRGVNEATISVANADDGTPADGLVLEVVPWMPAHGHGASVKTEVEPLGGGRYHVKNVVFFMAGRWELRTTVTAPAEDHATAFVDVD